MEKDATLHYGLGCDSSWLIWDYLTNPKSKFRKYNISKVLISQTGLESKLVQEQVEQIIFPLLREHKIRTIQIARKSSTLRDGFTILDDTDSPEICYIKPTAEKPYYTCKEIKRCNNFRVWKPCSSVDSYKQRLNNLLIILEPL
jgi:hypothetical protein